MPNVVDTHEAFETVKAAMQEDMDLAWAWHCNLAVASQDEGMEHAASNRAAARFMSACFGVDMNKSPLYLNTQSTNNSEVDK